ncbi:MAG: 3-deoxy-manno-octulosonate cytidylyltransferase [Ginsengibacter sp.]
MNRIAMIPARYNASRFPGKLMQIIGDKSIIRHTYDNTLATLLFDEVIVVTDSDVIFKEITENGGYAIKSKKEHESGTDRIAEAAESIDADIILNVQGDEPFIDQNALRRLLQVFDSDEEHVQVASIMKKLTEKSEIQDPNRVKVVVDSKMNSLFFSRSVIPYSRESTAISNYYQHIGVYAFRKPALLKFTSWRLTPLEAIEKLECLRFLEMGIPIKMVLTDFVGIAIDSPDDLKKAIEYYNAFPD